MSYIGIPPQANFSSGLLDRFTSTTGTTVTLTHDIASENDIVVFVNFVKQDSTTYSVGGTGNKTLTLGGTLVSSDIVEVHYLNIVAQTNAPSSGSVGSSQISADVITGQTELASGVASTDELLISDGGVLKRVDVSLVGGNNTPAFLVRLSGNQTLSHDTLTRITWDTEDYDTDNAFASNVFTVPSGEGGKYVFNYCVFGDDSDDTDTFSAYIEVDGTANADSNSGLASPRSSQNMILRAVTIITLTAGQVVEVVAKHQGTNQSEVVRSSGSFFSGHKLIGV